MNIGLDFGTTNSSIARVLPNGDVQLAQFAYSGGVTEAFRSILYLEKQQSTLKSWAGPEAIDQYLAADTKGRLIQSMKSFLTSRSLKSTDIFGRPYTLEALIARILRNIREKAEEQFAVPVRSVVVGRPVHFVGAASEADNAYALSRLQSALQQAGFEDVQFEMEPVGAARHYQSTLDHDELILIGDFGGGTSDFSLLRLGSGTQQSLLGNEGVGIAGDAFDAKIVRHLVSPALGAGTYIRSMHKVLPAPTWVHAKLERWHHLSFLRTRDVINMLTSVKAQAIEPRKIEALLHLIEEDLGYQLHRAVQRTKCQLSEAERAQFHFADGGVEIEAMVTRQEFESWIADELHAVEGCVDSLLKTTGVHARDVDMVFLTGGSSFVPAVRRIFETRFGTRIQTGNEFTSVARGLAMVGPASLPVVSPSPKAVPSRDEK